GASGRACRRTAERRRPASVPPLAARTRPPASAAGVRAPDAPARRRCIRKPRRSRPACRENNDCGEKRLALAELEAGAGTTLTVLLALFDARVAGDHAGLLERRTEGGVDLHQRAGDTVLDGVGLAREPAAVHVDEDVVAVDGLGQLERLAQDHLRGGAPEVLV